MNETTFSRRDFLKSASIATSTALIAGAPQALFAAEEKKMQHGVEEVPAVEDLMREHGALRRILLIYEEAVRRIRGREELNPAVVKQSAVIVNDFVHGYHEKLEEEHLFPRLKKAQRLVPTVDTLLSQHQAGRVLTGKALFAADDSRFKDPANREVVASALEKFVRMYRPHAAREDTIVFPEFKKLLTPGEYDKLGHRFEAREKELFGKDGFQGMLSRIAKLEAAMGLDDLARFTPTD